ncbi:MAG: hypothetical protein AAFR44_04510, partial [Pseudomonadota bacterium]
MQTAIKALCLFLVLSVVAAGALWLLRIPMAGVYLDRWCDERALQCEASITGLGLGHVSAEGLSIESGGHQPFAADAVTVRWDWAGAFSPAVRDVVIDRPRIEAEFDGEAITLHGLEALVPEGDGDAPLPAITITDGGLTLTTPAGALEARYAADLRDADHGSLRASISPVVLERDDDRIVLDAAALDLALSAGVPMGEGRIELAEARLGTFMATDVSGGLTIDD